LNLLVFRALPAGQAFYLCSFRSPKDGAERYQLNVLAKAQNFFTYITHLLKGMAINCLLLINSLPLALANG